MCQRLEHATETLGFGVRPVLLYFGNMPHDKTLKNIEMFATKIIPHLGRIYAQLEIQQPALAATD